MIRQEMTVASGSAAGRDTAARGSAGVHYLGDAAAVAEKLQISKRTVLRLADRGILPWGVRIGGARRWDLQEIDEWIAGGCRAVRRK